MKFWILNDSIVVSLPTVFFTFRLPDNLAFLRQLYDYVYESRIFSLEYPLGSVSSQSLSSIKFERVYVAYSSSCSMDEQIKSVTQITIPREDLLPDMIRLLDEQIPKSVRLANAFARLCNPLTNIICPFLSESSSDGDDSPLYSSEDDSRANDNRLYDRIFSILSGPQLDFSDISVQLVPENRESPVVSPRDIVIDIPDSPLATKPLRWEPILRIKIPSCASETPELTLDVSPSINEPDTLSVGSLGSIDSGEYTPISSTEGNDEEETETERSEDENEEETENARNNDGDDGDAAKNARGNDGDEETEKGRSNDENEEIEENLPVCSSEESEELPVPAPVWEISDSDEYSIVAIRE